MTEPKPVVLPLHHRPIAEKRVQSYEKKWKMEKKRELFNVSPLFFYQNDSIG